MSDLSGYKSKLLNLRSELTKRGDAIAKDLHHEEEQIEKDFSEQATQMENRDVLMSLSGDTKLTVMKIDKALMRIEDGSYGTCESCGEKINEQRLEVVPFANLCIKCAESES